MPAVEIILPRSDFGQLTLLRPEAFWKTALNSANGRPSRWAAGGTIGFIVGRSKPPNGIKLRDIVDVIDDKPLFDEKRLEFFKWIADYYICPLGAVVKAAHPSGLGSMSMKRTVALTEAGIRALEGEKAKEVEKTVLRALSMGGAMTLEKTV